MKNQTIFCSNQSLMLDGISNDVNFCQHDCHHVYPHSRLASAGLPMRMTTDVLWSASSWTRTKLSQRVKCSIWATRNLVLLLWTYLYEVHPTINHPIGATIWAYPYWRWFKWWIFNWLLIGFTSHHYSSLIFVVWSSVECWMRGSAHPAQILSLQSLKQTVQWPSKAEIGDQQHRRVDLRWGWI